MNVSIYWDKNYHAVLLIYKSRSKLYTTGNLRSSDKIFEVNVFNFKKQ